MKWLSVLMALMMFMGCSASEDGDSSSGNASSAATSNKVKKVKPRSKKKKPVEDITKAYSSVPQAIAALTASLEDRKDRDWVKASKWLVAQGDPARQPLADLLHDESANLQARVYSCRLLAQLGPIAADDLMAVLSDKEPVLRTNAATQLGFIKPSNPQIVKTLVGLIDSDEKMLRHSAIGALANIGPQAKEAAPKLLAILDNDEEEKIFRDAAKKALVKVNPRRTFKD